MNRERRKNIQSIIDQLEKLSGAIEEIQYEEEEYRDNIPENLQSSERYEVADEAVSSLESAISSLEEVIASLEEAKGE